MTNDSPVIRQAQDSDTLPLLEGAGTPGDPGLNTQAPADLSPPAAFTKAPQYLARSKELTPLEKLVCLDLITRLGQGEDQHLFIKTIAEGIGASYKRTQEAMKKLEALDWIKTRRTTRGKKYSLTWKSNPWKYLPPAPLVELVPEYAQQFQAKKDRENPEIGKKRLVENVRVNGTKSPKGSDNMYQPIEQEKRARKTSNNNSSPDQAPGFDDDVFSPFNSYCLGVFEVFSKIAGRKVAFTRTLQKDPGTMGSLREAFEQGFSFDEIEQLAIYYLNRYKGTIKNRSSLLANSVPQILAETPKADQVIETIDDLLLEPINQTERSPLPEPGAEFDPEKILAAIAEANPQAAPIYEELLKRGRNA